MTPFALVVYCGVLMSISAFSVDIMLPAFAEITGDLAAPYELVQWTVPVYMIAAGVAQLLWGSASDRFGRRPVLATGLCIFLAGCVVAALAPGIVVLLAARLLQGFGAAAAIVSSRAILRDRYRGEELARNLALATAIFAAGPILAPLVGAGIALPFGWRAIFIALSLFAVGLLLVLTRLPETLPQRAPDALRPSIFIERAGRLLTEPQSRHFLVVSAVSMSSMLLILTVAPRLYDIHFGITGLAFALFFASHGLGIVIGQTANRRLIPRLGLLKTTILANGILILAALMMLATVLVGAMNAYVMTALAILFATSYLIVYSNAAALVLDPHGSIAGFTAAFYGFVSQIGSAVLVSTLVVLIGDSLVGFTVALTLICLACLGLLLYWRHRGLTRRKPLI